jgi:pimeloyl-ACP methyl ester carboxylesterase
MPESDLEAEDRYFESSRLRLHYAVWGDESKPPLLLVHGGRDHARSWDLIARAMTGRFCVYALDLRGHGDSDWATGGAYSVSDHVGDLAALVERIGAASVSLVGHSLGGRVVLDYASAFPDRVSKVVAIEGFGRVGSQRPAIERLRAYLRLLAEMQGRRPHPYESLEAAEARMLEANQRLSPEMVRHLTSHAVRRQEDGTYVWKFDNYVRLTSPTEWGPDDTEVLWRNIKAPTLHIGGSDSWGKRFPDGREALTKNVPNSRTVIVDGAGHWVHHDQFEVFVRLIREFLG